MDADELVGCFARSFALCFMLWFVFYLHRQSSRYVLSSLKCLNWIKYSIIFMNHDKNDLIWIYSSYLIVVCIYNQWFLKFFLFYVLFWHVLLQFVIITVLVLKYHYWQCSIVSLISTSSSNNYPLLTLNFSGGSLARILVHMTHYRWIHPEIYVSHNP